MANEKTYPTALTLLSEGQILKAFGMKYFISVTPAPYIDKVKWEQVQIGSKGKTKATFWMSMEDMRQLCSDILSDNKWFQKRIAADKENYPSAYKYVSGADGANHLNIGNGQKGCRVQVQNKENRLPPSVVSMTGKDSLTSMAFYFNLVFGFETPNSPYYKNLVDAFWKSAENNKNFFKVSEEEVADYEQHAEPQPDPKDAKTQVQEKPQKQEKPQPERTTLPQPESTLPQTDVPEGNLMVIKTAGLVKKDAKSGFFYLNVDVEEKGNRTLVINQTGVEVFGKDWTVFQQGAGKGITLKIYGKESGDQILFTGKGA